MPDPLSPVMMTMSGDVWLFRFGILETRTVSGRKRKRGATSHQCYPSEKFCKKSWSRLNQAEVSVLPLIEHAHSVGIRVAKYDKAIGAGRKFERRLFSGHWLHAVSSRVNNSHWRRRGFHLSVRRRRNSRSFPRAMLAIDNLLL